MTFAQSSVFKRFLGTRRIHVDLRSAIPEMPVRHFATVGDLRREIVNARVWGGIHFRSSNKVGGALGDRVAAWALDRFFRRL